MYQQQYNLHIFTKLMDKLHKIPNFKTCIIGHFENKNDFAVKELQMTSYLNIKPHKFV